jgi:flagellar hook-associated protein FlgK/chemotaxis methyl-accepting protein methylase
MNTSLRTVELPSVSPDFLLTDHDFSRIRTLLHERAGIALGAQKRQMVCSRLARRLRELRLKEFSAYLSFLESDPNSAEWQLFTNALTTNLTSFFREAHHFPVLAEHARSFSQPLSVWCSAASTEEEPYSIAMTLIEALGSRASSASVVATDIDTQVLAKAKSGVFTMEQVCKLSQERLKRFFLKGSGAQAGLVKIRPEVAAMVKFSRLNLLDPKWALSEGQTLVLGDKATRLETINSASDPSPTTIATVNAAGQKIDVQESMIAGGSLGGLLQFRSETLTTAQNSLGRLAIALADSFNAQQKLGVDLNGVPGGDFFSQASPGVTSNSTNSSGATLAAAFSDMGKLTISDYRVDATGAATYTVTRLSANTIISPDLAGAYDGVKLTLGGAASGDSFLIQPSRTGARDLTAILTDPAKVAAASPVLTGNTADNQGSGAISAGSVDAGFLAVAAPLGTPTPPATGVTLKYDNTVTPATLSGFPAAVTVTLADGATPSGSPYTAGTNVPFSACAKMSFNGITVTVSGAPSSNDTFTISKNTGGVFDGSNALLLGALQNKMTIGNGTASFNDAYGQLVSTVGNKARQVQIANTAQTSLTAQIRSAQQSVSGVNQDEETANLLMFQQMYQANAKVIQTASSMFDAVLGIR